MWLEGPGGTAHQDLQLLTAAALNIEDLRTLRVWEPKATLR